MQEGKSLIRGTAIVSLLTQLSRVLGFVREVLTARLLGTGFYSDAFFVAFRIPNLLRSFVAEGALTSAFVPLFASELERSKEDAQRALNVVAGFLVQVTVALTILGIIFAPQIVHLFAPGFEPEKISFCTTLTRVMLPYIVLVSLVAMLNGALNSVHIFGTAAWAQVLMNVVLILGAVIGFWFNQKGVALVLSWSVIAGGILGITSQLPALRRSGFAFKLSFNLGSPHVRQLSLLMLPAIFGAAIYQINIFLSTVFASLLREGSVSWIYYADRLAQLPIGVFTVALGSVLLPTLSRAHARQDTDGFTRGLLDSLRYTSFLMVPTAFILFYFADPLIILFLEGGKFTRASSLNSSLALQAFSIGLWAVSCHAIALKAFLARKDTVTPALLGCLSLLSSVVFSLLLMGVPESVHSDKATSIVSRAQTTLYSIFPHADLGHTGLALSSSLAAYVAFVTLGVLLMVRIPHFNWRPFLVATLKSIISVCVCAAVLSLLRINTLNPWVSLTAGLPITVVLFYFAAKLLKAHEISETANLVRTQLQKRRKVNSST